MAISPPTEPTQPTYLIFGSVKDTASGIFWTVHFGKKHQEKRRNNVNKIVIFEKIDKNSDNIKEEEVYNLIIKVFSLVGQIRAVMILLVEQERLMFPSGIVFLLPFNYLIFII